MSGMHPKEMLLIGDKPMIYYTVLEAALSGLEEIYVVINKYKDALREYLEGEGLIKDLREQAGNKAGIRSPIIRFVEQPSPLGSGEAIYRTKGMVGEEPVAVMMPDRILFGPCGDKDQRGDTGKPRQDLHRAPDGLNAAFNRIFKKFLNDRIAVILGHIQDL